jgi:hypothetical protein
MIEITSDVADNYKGLLYFFESVRRFWGARQKLSSDCGKFGGLLSPLWPLFLAGWLTFITSHYFWLVG